jgi:hypothetical protein
VTTDPINCGGCGNICPSGSSCTAGRCVCTNPSQQVCYPSGFPICIDVQTDSSNCGSCGNACPPSTICRAGACQCADSSDGGAADAGADGGDGGGGGLLTSCGNACVDTQSDPSNCGSCGAVCAPDATCALGACSCPSDKMKCGGSCVDTSFGLSDCGGNCVNTQFDSSNCGACGNACPQHYFCDQGTCAFACGKENVIFCTNFGCVDPNFDRRNCGGCDTACKANSECQRGLCGCPSWAPADCGASCSDLSSDADNCGACGSACPSGQRLCSAGVCAPCTAAGFAECGNNCVDIRIDKRNCGACGLTCADNQACVQGACVAGM